MTFYKKKINKTVRRIDLKVMTSTKPFNQFYFLPSGVKIGFGQSVHLKFVYMLYSKCKGNYMCFLYNIFK